MTKKLLRIVNCTKQRGAFHRFQALAKGDPVLLNNTGDIEMPQWPLVFFYEGDNLVFGDGEHRENIVVLARNACELVSQPPSRLLWGRYDPGFFGRREIVRLLDSTGEPYDINWSKASKRFDGAGRVYMADEMHFGRASVVERLTKYLRVKE